MQHTILIVDDEPDVVALLRDNFTMLGYLVLTATGCDEAVEKAARGPDIILLDVNMPGRDGLERLPRHPPVRALPDPLPHRPRHRRGQDRGLRRRRRRLRHQALFPR